VRYEFRLDRDGNPLGIVTLTGSKAKNDRGPVWLVPSIVRTVAVNPILLVDTAEYALGWGRPDKAARYHAAFVTLVNACAAATDDADVHAIATYLARPETERLPMPDDFDPTQTVAFSVEGRFPAEVATVRAFWSARTDRSARGGEGDVAQCLVCGVVGAVVDRLPQPIKGIPGGQPSGVALTSANTNAFESYGLTANYVAPMCRECADLVCKALNTLVADEQSRLYLRPLVYVYWTRGTTEFNPFTMLSQAAPEDVRALVDAVRTARPGALALDSTAFHCLALTGNGGRLVVRDWLDTTVGNAHANLTRYFQLQRLAPPDGRAERFVGLYALSRAPELADTEPPAETARALLRVALHGGPLPAALLSRTLRRLRAAQGLTFPQAVLIKMTLASWRGEGEEDWMIALDESNTQPAYLCGRLLAVLDAIQRAALGERNATIVDRFFGAASTAPISVFGRLVRGAQPHLGKLRRDRPNVAFALETRMQNIVSQLGTFPRTLTLRDQGLFVLGYYHQRAADTRARIERAEARRAETDTQPNDETETIDTPAA
jgi:CRISPR-associated protein Csd1